MFDSKQPLEMYATPEEAGVSSAGLLGFLDAWEALRSVVQIHSLILLRHGKIVTRMNFAPYDDRTPHNMFSLSKSFTSAAAGFAVHEGKLSWDSSVVDILPEEIPDGREEELRPITLEALLCMGSGLAPESDSPSSDSKITWACHVLSHPVLYPPKTHFHYNTYGTYLVSCMIQKVTGQTVRDYLIPRLFKPLGIDTPDWDMSPQGISCGGFGLHLPLDGIVRFGQCLLQKGHWQGRQILPEGWVELATREHIANYEGTREDGNEWAQGYGFQFWRCMDGRYRGDGAMGQACIVDEQRDAVLAVTCGVSDMGAEFKLFRDHIFTAIDAPAGDERQQAELQRRIAALHYDFPTDDGTDAPLPEGMFETFCESVRMRISLRKSILDHLCLTVQYGDEEPVPYYLPRGQAGLATVIPNGPSMRSGIRVFGAYGWQQGQLHFSLRTPDGPETIEGRLTWTENELVFNGISVDFVAAGSHLVFTRVRLP